MSFEKILLEFSKNLLELLRNFSCDSRKHWIYWLFATKKMSFNSSKLLKVIFLVKIMVNFDKLAIQFFGKFPISWVFRKNGLSFWKNLVEFWVSSPWVLGWTPKKTPDLGFFFTKMRFFEIFILLNFDTFYKFGCSSLKFQLIFYLKTANTPKITLLL